MNPLHAMPQVSGIPLTNPSVFKQTVVDDYTDQIASMKGFVSDPAKVLTLAIVGFRRAVRASKLKMAIRELSRMYHNKAACVKLILEVAIDVVPVRNVGLVNWVFWATSEESIDNPIILVLIVRELCNVDFKNIKDYAGTYNQGMSIQDMIDDAGDKCSDLYQKLELCSERYHTYPLYLKEYAQPKAGSLVHTIELESEAEVDLARMLESI